MRAKRFVAGILTLAMVMSCAVLPGVNSRAAVKISKKSLTLQVGKKSTLKLKKAKGNISWKSSNKAVATVSKKGVVKAMHSGVATISAKNKKKTYKCTVTVKSSTAKSAINTLLSNSRYLYTSETSKLKAYKSKASNRRKEILDSPTSITKSSTFIRGETYTGTAYYVSEKSGNDDNDGLTPETAWQTIDRVGWQDYAPGDAIFFERGGTYVLREGSLAVKKDVTYSAYGQGEKPIITMVQENSAATDKWILYYEKGKKKIWKYNSEVYDVAGIFFNDGTYATREMEWPTPAGWKSVSLEKTDPLNLKFNEEDPGSQYMIVDNKKYNTVESALLKDITYLSRFDCSDITYPYDYIENSYGKKGELYLRCDAGNPGKVYKKISIIAVQESQYGWLWDNLIDGWQVDGCVIDNLHLTGYARDAYDGDLDSENIVIQNCEVSWGGNRLHRFDSETPYQNGPIIGDGLYCIAHNATIRNNYMHQINEGCTFEDSMEHGPLGTYKVYGNLMEHCIQGVRVGLWEDASVGSFSKVEIYDNIIVDSGDSFNNGCMEQADAIDIGSDPCKWADDIEIHDNILLGSTQAMFRLPPKDSWQANIHDNVIAQKKSGYLICDGTWNWIESKKISTQTWYMMVDAK